MNKFKPPEESRFLAW